MACARAEYGDLCATSSHSVSSVAHTLFLPADSRHSISRIAAAAAFPTVLPATALSAPAAAAAMKPAAGRYSLYSTATSVMGTKLDSGSIHIMNHAPKKLTSGADRFRVCRTYNANARSSTDTISLASTPGISGKS